MKNELNEIILNTPNKNNRTLILSVVAVAISFIVFILVFSSIKSSGEFDGMSPFEVRNALQELRAERKENDRQIASALRHYSETGDRSKLEDLVRDRTKD